MQDEADVDEVVQGLQDATLAERGRTRTPPGDVGASAGQATSSGSAYPAGGGAQPNIGGGGAAPTPPVGPGVCNLRYFHDFVAFDRIELAGSFTKVRGLSQAIFGKVLLSRWDLEAMGAAVGARAIEIGSDPSQPPSDVDAEALEVSQQALAVFREAGAGPHRVVCKKMSNEPSGSNPGVDTCRKFPADDRQAHLQQKGAAEDAMNEIGVLMYLMRQEPCPNLLRSLGCFRDATHTTLVTEYCDGGELFQVCASGQQLSENQIRNYMAELLQAVRHLHRHNVGHRDISLENILMQGGVLKLMDFGQAVCLYDPDGRRIRYFRAAGKAYYRSPETYVPPAPACQALCPAGYIADSIVQLSWPLPGVQQGYVHEVCFGADAVEGQPCVAQTMGYLVEPLDMFACGVAMFILHAQVPPWGMALPSDRSCAFIKHKGLEALWTAYKKPLLSRPAMELLRSLLDVNPATRATLQTCLESPWFEDGGPDGGGGDPPGGGEGGGSASSGGNGGGIGGAGASSSGQGQE